MTEHHDHVHVAVTPEALDRARRVGGPLSQRIWRICTTCLLWGGDHADNCPDRPAVVGGDHDSVGLFQQASAGWGRVDTNDQHGYRDETPRGYTLSDLQALKAWINEHRLRPVDLLHQPEENVPMSDFIAEHVEKINNAHENIVKARGKVARAEAKLDRAKERLAEAEEEHRHAHYPEPSPGVEFVTFNGRVAAEFVTFKTSHGRRVFGGGYNYAAVGVYAPSLGGFRWYLTGNKNHDGEAMSWSELLEFAGADGRRSLRRVTDSEAIAR